MKYGLVLDPVFGKHRTPAGHPERPERIYSMIETLESCNKDGRIRFFPPVPVEGKWLEKVHSSAYVERIRQTADLPFSQLDPDTFTGPDSFEVAMLAAGSCVDLSRRIVEGEIDTGFVLARPPGHHAESGRPMGFCLFNNVAAAAEFLLASGKVDRVAIVDFDVHHGNGTQEIFYSRSDVLYISSHQYPLYPGTGSREETGRDKGEGYTVNFPLPAGTGNSFMISLYRDSVVPALRRYEPGFILVSAGFDAHRDDPLAGLELDEDGFGAIAGLLNAAASELCAGRILYVLEGGYNLDALAKCVRRTIETALHAGP